MCSHVSADHAEASGSSLRERKSRYTSGCQQFSKVIVEDSTVITLPGELADIWLGCGKPGEAGEAAVKVFIRWNVSSGEMPGPRLADGRRNDHKSPFEIDELPEESLYIADLGFFAIERLFRIALEKNRKRYFVTRLQPKTNLYDRRGHLRNIEGMLPQQIGQVREVGVILGQKKGLPVRLIPGHASRKKLRKNAKLVSVELRKKTEAFQAKRFYGWHIGRLS